MEGINPGRLQWLLLRNRMRMSRRGLELLKVKRQALWAEYSPLWDRTFQGRLALKHQVVESNGILQAALSISGMSALGSAALSAARDVEIEWRRRNLWGVRFLELQPKKIVRALNARGYFFPGGSSGVDLTAKAFERVLEEVLRRAAEEVKLRKIGAAIQTTGRRIRILEDRILPNLVRETRRIRNVLEEREREEVFRLKRFKDRNG